MPAGSSPKRERQYEHIKESYKERGVSTDEAEERGADREQGAPRARRGEGAEEALAVTLARCVVRRREPSARRDVDPAVAAFLGWMLDEGDNAVRHEAARPYRRSAPGHLRDLDDAAGGRDLEPPAVARRNDVERLHAALACVDHDLDPVASHGRTIQQPPVAAR
jgi:hypothetical protein